MRWWFPLVLLLLPFAGSGQTVYSKFMKHWEGGDVEYGYGVVQAPDGDFVVTGYLGTGASSFDACIMKLNPGGTPIWIQSYGGPDVESAFGVKVMRDGGLAVAANTTSFGHGLMDMLVMKTDLLGNVIWSRAIGGPGEDMATAIDTTLDGGLIVCGYTTSFGAGNTDIYVVKLDAVGNLQWTRVVGGPTAETSYDVVATPDGGYAISGQTVSFGAGLTDYYLVKLNAAGAVTFTATYGGTNHDFGYRLGATTDDHLLLAGYTTSFGVGSDGLLLKVSLATGALVWARHYGTPAMDRIFDVFQTRDGNYVATGEGTTSTFGSGDQQILKVSPLGNLIWARHYGTASDETGYGVGMETQDRGLVLVGWDDSAEDIFVNKMDSTGDSGCNNAAIALATGSPVVTVGTGGVNTTGGTALNVAIPHALFGMTEVPYCSVVLPEGDVRFVGEVIGDEHRLSWEIAQPERFSFVALDRSVDGQDFTSIWSTGDVQAHARYSDAAAEEAQYYRLQLLDRDGMGYYSRVLRMEGRAAGRVLKFHHPNGQLEARRFQGLSATLPVQWSLVDGGGKVVAMGNVSAVRNESTDLNTTDGGSIDLGVTNAESIIFGNVNAGVFGWVVRQEGRTWVEKVVLVR